MGFSRFRSVSWLSGACREERVGDDEFGARHIGERKRQRHGGDEEADLVALEAEERAAEAAAAVHRAVELDPGLKTGKARVILAAHQRAIEAGRAHLEVVGAGNGIADIEKRREGAA